MVELIFKPTILDNYKIDWQDTINCPICNSILVKSNITYSRIIKEHECRACNLGVLNCSCYSETIDISAIQVKCENCYNKTKANLIINNIKPYSFSAKWINSSPIQKLSLYGKEKLLILAKNKNINIPRNIKKGELINILSNSISENDFPIK